MCISVLNCSYDLMCMCGSSQMTFKIRQLIQCKANVLYALLIEIMYSAQIKQM